MTHHAHAIPPPPAARLAVAGPAVPPSSAIGIGAAPWRGRLLVLAGIALAALNLRTAVTSLTPLLDSLGREFGFGSAMTGVFGMVPTAAFGLFGVATPAIARRLGLERTVLVAMLLAAAGLLARAFAGGTADLLIASAVALSGMGIGNVVLPPLVKRYFADRLGATSSMYIAVLQFGTIVPAVAAVPLADLAGWRVSLGAWSLVALAATLPWAITLWAERYGRTPIARALAATHDRAVAPGDEAPELAAPVATGRVWRSPVAWGMALMFGMTSLVSYSMFTWLPKLLIDAGGSATLGGTMVGLYSAMGLISALSVPSLAVRMRNPFPLVLACCAAHLAAFAGLLLAPMTFTALWVALLGLGPATFPLALTLINLRTRSAPGSAALSGFTQGLGYVLSCAGPLLFGLLHDRFGGWLWPFAFLTVCLLVLATGGYLACRPRMLEDSW
ncbi:MFS transporter [Montanilutibacter psychrotolerans]|uniref:MFS transporter n=1 Tax=Montanilutibacter psychrotolerans TaxID=1327343 RepID=A0A3M8SXM4_9GAMM|nr:MFS transporter [Lysobacter psychrotolerans]RNF86067.1 MFS transporter [Lysobacter psychrotolerans]